TRLFLRDSEAVKLERRCRVSVTQVRRDFRNGTAGSKHMAGAVVAHVIEAQTNKAQSFRKALESLTHIVGVPNLVWLSRRNCEDQVIIAGIIATKLLAQSGLPLLFRRQGCHRAGAERDKAT